MVECPRAPSDGPVNHGRQSEERDQKDAGPRQAHWLDDVFDRNVFAPKPRMIDVTAVRMNATEVGEAIELEISGDWSMTNSHGVDLTACLVTPIRQTYDDSFREGETLDLWLVLVESPDTGEGYRIVFDEQRQMYGLAIAGDVNDVFLGYYGSFMETLRSM